MANRPSKDAIGRKSGAKKLAKTGGKSAVTRAGSQTSKSNKATSQPDPGKRAPHKKSRKSEAAKSASGNAAETTRTVRSPKTRSPKTVLLSGGNPQIAKGYGDAPVRAYIAAMPGWKSGVGRRLDEIIVRNVPGVRKAVKWNSPFYGVEDDEWFLSFRCFTNYIKLAFFRGTSLRPVPPVESRHDHVRYLHIHEHDSLDEHRLAAWIRQASRLPGERM